MNMRIYIANLGKYNEGKLVGEWIDLPAEEEEFEELYVRIKVGHYNKDGEYVPGYQEGLSVYEEIAIHDYELPFKIDEYENISELNELCRKVEEMPEIIQNELQCITDVYWGIEDICEKYDEIITYPGCYTMTELAEYIVEETMLLDGVRDTVARYFDYESFGRDLQIEGSFTVTDSGIFEFPY